jgi:hypothetical protein
MANHYGVVCWTPIQKGSPRRGKNLIEETKIMEKFIFILIILFCFSCAEVKLSIDKFQKDTDNHASTDNQDGGI